MNILKYIYIKIKHSNKIITNNKKNNNNNNKNKNNINVNINLVIFFKIIFTRFVPHLVKIIIIYRSSWQK